MISETELMAVKNRLMIAADAAHRIVASPGPEPVRYTEDEYWLVHESLSRMGTDLTAVLTELDTLRAMFRQSVEQFFSTEVTNEIPISTNAVEAVPAPEDRGSGEAARDDTAVPSEPPPARRAYRRRAKGAKPRGDTPSVPVATEGVDPGTEGESVGR